ncbi:uncharacterized protein DSM5745_11162 [Aspergillus mulundensis]|uniref:BTB domain-containing protein n=1 Tax=Aspergillus mulundensis TaxID=1810919 RepID=A0A3D8QAU7_9EURO|nr:hypothetical protein DSM5745_11162 [Aspergillus mulundensis]RDW58956.1 hypothetical protein DSM5745_11162 [Aspergillus mulundensis]
MDNMEIIDTEGDVIVTCAEMVSFLVSRKALSLASSKLCAMLKPLIESESGGCLTLCLPDDDPEAFRLFFQIAHHRRLPSPDSPSANLLHSLAIIIDKYRCRDAMEPWGRIWLSQIHNRRRPQEDVWQFVQFAYVLKNTKSFFRYSRELLSLGLDESCITNLGLMPNTTLGAFKEKKQRISDDVQVAIMETHDRFAEFQCAYARSFLADHVTGLKTAGLLPSTAVFKAKSFNQIQRDAKSLRPSSYECAPHGRCRCSGLSGYKPKASLNDGLEKCWQKMGLCLPCFDGYCEEHPIVSQ